MTDLPSDWTSFHQGSLGRPPREFLRRTLGFFTIEERAPGVAVDLACGSGADTLELLRRGWEVHAVDSSESGLLLLQQHVPEDHRNRLHLHANRFEEFAFPACDLIWASHGYPFCERAQWPTFWSGALRALRVGGRIAGDFFGDQHAFAPEPDVMVLTEAQARDALSSLRIEAFDIEDGYRPSGGQITRWHAFSFSASKLSDA